MTQKIKAAGYIRVSSAGQVENESLTTQRNAIKKFTKANEYRLTEIYADEGISGGTVSERDALLRALHDAQSNKFDVLIIRDLSRFGRNARELLENHQELTEYGIKLRSIKEGINFDTAIGKAMLTMLAAIGELELTMIKERMYESRIGKAKRGVPTSGRLPFGREYDKAKDEWSLDPTSKRGIRWAAEQYLAGESMQDISIALQDRFGLPLTYSHLLNVLKKRCGDTWTVNFEDEEPITYDIPRILPEETIQKITDRLAHNHTNNRADINNKYVLTGFIRCMHCMKSLSGQTQHEKYRYYVHDSKKSNDCHEFTTVPLPKIEDAVFSTIFENIEDVPSFEKAISQNLPDEEFITDLENKIQAGERDIKKLERKLDKLVDAVLSGALKKETVKEREQNLIKAKQQAIQETQELKKELDSLPNIEEIKQEASELRRRLLEKYSGEDRLEQMTFDEKKQLLHWLFDGKAPNGDHYGIYVDKKGTGKNAEIDYMMFGRLTGLRTIKGDDIDYMPEDESSHSKTDYKTNNITTLKK